MAALGAGRGAGMGNTEASSSSSSLAKSPWATDSKVHELCVYSNVFCVPGIVLGAKATAGGQDSMVPITHHRVYILAGQLKASQMVLVVKNTPATAGDLRDWGSIPGPQRSAGAGQGNPLEYFCLVNPKDSGAWWATAPGVSKSQTWLKWLSMQGRWIGEFHSSVMKRNEGTLGGLLGLQDEGGFLENLEFRVAEHHRWGTGAALVPLHKRHSLPLTLRWPKKISPSARTWGPVKGLQTDSLLFPGSQGFHPRPWHAQNKTFESFKHLSENILLPWCSPFQELEASFIELHRSKNWKSFTISAPPSLLSYQISPGCRSATQKYSKSQSFSWLHHHHSAPSYHLITIQAWAATAPLGRTNSRLPSTPTNSLNPFQSNHHTEKFFVVFCFFCFLSFLGKSILITL